MRLGYEKGADGLYRKFVEWPDPHDRTRTLTRRCLVRDEAGTLVRVVQGRGGIQREMTLQREGETETEFVAV